jgi:hypothetical protein
MPREIIGSLTAPPTPHGHKRARRGTSEATRLIEVEEEQCVVSVGLHVALEFGTLF